MTDGGKGPIMSREMRVEVRDGTRLRVELRGEERAREEGGGPWLVLLHGFTGSVEAWGELLLESLARRHPVLAVDLPGHGGSDVPAGLEQYGVERLVTDLGDVLDRLSIPEAVWVGYSMGGRLALGAAVLGPERVAGLVLESASPGLETEAERRARRERDEALARRILSTGVDAFVNDWMAQPLFASQRDLPELVQERERRRRKRASARGLAGSLLGMGTGAQPSFWGRLGELEMPVLVLTGALDRKFEAIGDRMAEAIPRATRRSVPEAGHTVHLERPEAWLEGVFSFVGSIR